MTVYDASMHFLHQLLRGCHALAYLVYHALVTGKLLDEIGVYLLRT